MIVLNLKEYLVECKESLTVKAAFRVWFLNNKRTELERLEVDEWEKLLNQFKNE